MPHQLPGNKAERLKEHARSVNEMRILRKVGVRGMYAYLDSDLISSHNRFDTSYEATFSLALPKGEKDLGAYIVKNMAHTVPRGGIVVVDAGGTGRRVANDVSYIGTDPKNEWALGVRRSLGVTFQDESPDLQETDLERKHTVLEGDLREEETEDKVDDWLHGDQIDLLFERMAGGMGTMPNEPYNLGAMLDRWYGRLADGGIMFIEIPVQLNAILATWVTMLKNDFSNFFEVGYHLGEENGTVGKESSLILRKLPGAPVSLPYLDSHTIRSLTQGREAQDARTREPDREGPFKS